MNKVRDEFVKIKVLESLEYEHHTIIDKGELRQKSYVPLNVIIREMNKSRQMLLKNGFSYFDGKLKKLT